MLLDLNTFPFMGRAIIGGALHFVHDGNIGIWMTSRCSAHRLWVAITNVTAELGLASLARVPRARLTYKYITNLTAEQPYAVHLSIPSSIQTTFTILMFMIEAETMNADGPCQT